MIGRARNGVEHLLKFRAKILQILLGNDSRLPSPAESPFSRFCAKHPSPHSATLRPPCVAISERGKYQTHELLFLSGRCHGRRIAMLTALQTSRALALRFPSRSQPRSFGPSLPVILRRPRHHASPLHLLGATTCSHHGARNRWFVQPWHTVTDKVALCL